MLGKNLKVLTNYNFVCIQVVIFNLSLNGDDFTIIKKDLYSTWQAPPMISALWLKWSYSQCIPIAVQ
jgi:hypothetical protein